MTHRPILALAIWALTLAPAVAAEGPYPVWLSPSLGVERLEDVPAMLDRPLFFPPSGQYSFASGFPEDDPIHRVRTCNHVLDVLNRGIRGQYKELRRFGAPIYECLALAWVAKAKASDISFVREFKLDHNAPRYLPGTTDFDYPSCHEALKLYQAHRAGQSLADVVDNSESDYDFSRNENAGAKIDYFGGVARLAADQFYVITDPRRLWHHTPASYLTGRVGRLGPERAALYAKYSYHHMEIVARADFTDDGVEDLLIYRQMGSSIDSVNGHFIHNRSVFVLTRELRDAVLRVVDIAKFLATVCAAGGATFEETLTETESPPDALPPAPASPWRP